MIGSALSPEVQKPETHELVQPYPTFASYTPCVGWNLRTISTTMLMVLALLPLSGTLCALTCDVAANSKSSGHHHGAAQEGTTSAAAGNPVISGTSFYPCDHDVAIEQFTTAAERAPMAIAPPAALVAVDSFVAPRVQRVPPSQGAPPGTTPSTSNPVVLRV